jgi:hypothetical protein
VCIGIPGAKPFGHYELIIPVLTLVFFGAVEMYLECYMSMGAVITSNSAIAIEEPNYPFSFMNDRSCEILGIPVPNYYF